MGHAQGALRSSDTFLGIKKTMYVQDMEKP
jgi:hypothetical protein